MPLVQAPLMLSQASGAGPWAAVSVSAAVPLTQPLFAGYKLQKSVSIVSQKNKGWLTRGDVLRVTITVDATAERGSPVFGGRFAGAIHRCKVLQRSGHKPVWPVTAISVQIVCAGGSIIDVVAEVIEIGGGHVP